jgi:L-asparagine oxygenase
MLALFLSFIVSMCMAEEVCKLQKQTFLHVWSLESEPTAAWLDDLLQLDHPDYKIYGQEPLEALIESSIGIASKHLGENNTVMLRSKLADLGGMTHAVLVRNLPQDPNVPFTPVDGSRSLEKKTFVAEAVSIGLASLAGGSLVSYPGEKQYSNSFFHEGFALKEGGSAVNQKGTLPWHIDISYVPLSYAPDILVLYGVREGNDKEVKTKLLKATDVLRFVPSSVEQILRENRYKHKQPDWIDTLKPKAKPMIVGPSSNPTILAAAAGNSSAFNPNDHEAKDALDVLYGAIKEAETYGLAAEVHLREGDVLLFDQKHLLHTRKAYSAPLFDGNDRVLLRSYYVFDEELVQSMNRRIPW